MSDGSNEQKNKLLAIVLAAVKQDNELREKYQIGDKFRFIRDRLQALQTRVTESISAMQEEEKQKNESQIQPDETLIYVYIYNAQGLNFQTWHKLLNPAVFYEYSVNRPIYAEKSFVDTFVRSKPNQAQHGYLTIAIKKENILPEKEILTDSMGNSLIKVKEGSLHFEKLICFTQNGSDYVLQEDGELTKKTI